MKNFFNHILCSLWALGVIATANVPAVPPTRCNDAVSDQKAVRCTHMPIMVAWPEDGVPPIDRGVSQR